MLVVLGSLASTQSKGTEATACAATQLLNYCATHPDAVLQYKASDMVLHVHSDASYLSEHHAHSHAGGYFYLSTMPLNPLMPPATDASPPPLNGPVLIHSSIMSTILSSATEAETGALFYNAKEATVLLNTLNELGYPQPPTPIQTDNQCASGIANDSIHQCHSKAMDMHFYWVRDCVRQGEFHVYWRQGVDNLTDYFTKHHSPSHHHLMRSRYLLDLHHPCPSCSSQGCVDESRSPSHPRYKQQFSMTQSACPSISQATYHL